MYVNVCVFRFLCVRVRMFVCKRFLFLFILESNWIMRFFAAIFLINYIIHANADTSHTATTNTPMNFKIVCASTSAITLTWPWWVAKTARQAKALTRWLRTSDRAAARMDTRGLPTRHTLLIRRLQTPPTRPHHKESIQSLQPGPSQLLNKKYVYFGNLTLHSCASK